MNHTKPQDKLPTSSPHFSLSDHVAPPFPPPQTIHTSPPPSYSSSSFTTQEINSSRLMTSDLHLREPYSRYPPLGVPCPDTFQLGLQKSRWRRWIEWVWGVDLEDRGGDEVTEGEGGGIAESEDGGLEGEEEDQEDGVTTEKRGEEGEVDERREKKKQESEYLYLETKIAEDLQDLRRDSLAQALVSAAPKALNNDKKGGARDGYTPDNESRTKTDKGFRGRTIMRKTRKCSKLKIKTRDLEKETRGHGHGDSQNNNRSFQNEEDDYDYDEEEDNDQVRFEDDLHSSTTRGEHQSPHPPRPSYAAMLRQSLRQSPQVGYEMTSSVKLEPVERLPKWGSDGDYHDYHDGAERRNGGGKKKNDDVDEEEEEEVDDEEDDKEKSEERSEGEKEEDEEKRANNKTSTPHEASIGFWSTPRFYQTTEAQKRFLRNRGL